MTASSYLALAPEQRETDPIPRCESCGILMLLPDDHICPTPSLSAFLGLLCPPDKPKRGLVQRMWDWLTGKHEYPAPPDEPSVEVHRCSGCGIEMPSEDVQYIHRPGCVANILNISMRHIDDRAADTLEAVNRSALSRCDGCGVEMPDSSIQYVHRPGCPAATRDLTILGSSITDPDLLPVFGGSGHGDLSVVRTKDEVEAHRALLLEPNDGGTTREASKAVDLMASGLAPGLAPVEPRCCPGCMAAPGNHDQHCLRGGQTEAQAKLAAAQDQGSQLFDETDLRRARVAAEQDISDDPPGSDSLAREREAFERDQEQAKLMKRKPITAEPVDVYYHIEIKPVVVGMVCPACLQGRSTQAEPALDEAYNRAPFQVTCSCGQKLQCLHEDKRLIVTPGDLT